MVYLNAYCYGFKNTYTCYCYSSDKCTNPDTLFNGTDVIADCYEDPALEGYNITFTCPPGLVLTGPNATMCMGDGEWEPDPRLAKCKGE